MQERAGKYDGSASIGAEGLWAEFGENQFSAGVVVIEGEGDGELAVGGTGDGIVPMRVEKAFIRGVVGTDEHSVHLGSREAESPENLGDDAADDTVLQLRDDAPVAQGRVPPAFEIRGDGADRMSCGIGGQDGRGLVSAVGEDTALAFLESVGGQRIQVPRTAEGSRLATLYGVDVASALSAEYGGLSVEIPVCKKWRILVLAARGLPVNDIATRVGASWRYVRAVIQAGPAHIRVERRRKSSEIPGQLPLFA